MNSLEQFNQYWKNLSWVERYLIKRKNIAFCAFLMGRHAAKMDMINKAIKLPKEDQYD